MNPLNKVYEEMNINNDEDQQMLIKSAIKFCRQELVAPILDIGCADGWTTNYLTTVENLYTEGVSINETDCINAKKLYNINLFNSDMQKMSDVVSNSYNTIWCRHSIEHCTSPFNALLEMHRVLKDEGKVVLIVPYPLDILIFAESHLYVLDDKQWRNLFTKTGFNVYKKQDNFFLNGYAEVMYILKKVTDK